MKPHELKAPRGARKTRTRKGRGEAAGKGKTAGRGTKGTKARGEVHAFFEGGQMPLIRRVPKLKGFTPPTRRIYGAINVGKLKELEGDEFSAEDLHDAGVVRKRDKLIKVLGKGDIDRAITVRVHAVSESARTKIEAAGGTIELIGERTDQVRTNAKKGS
ncbi:MAG: 50S ribosomal protein L15 [Actinomycetota bacterium]